MIKVIAFTSALANAGEHRVTLVFVRDIANQLHQRHGLADTGTAEQTDLTTLGNRHDQVDNLNARFQNFGRRCLLFISRGRTMNGH